MAFSASVAADFMIAAALCILLWRRRTGFSRCVLSNVEIDEEMRWAEHLRCAELTRWCGC